MGNNKVEDLLWLDNATPCTHLHVVWTRSRRPRYVSRDRDGMLDVLELVREAGRKRLVAAQQGLEQAAVHRA